MKPYKPCIKRFVDEYIRSEYMQNLQAENDSTFYGRHAERAARCADAAEYGADGKTHYEAINDWREGLQAYIDNRRKGYARNYPYRFAAAIEAYFDSVEAWHEANGSLHEGSV